MCLVGNKTDGNAGNSKSSASPKRFEVTGSNDTNASSLLLDPAEPPAVEIINAEGHSNAVLLCDHASNLVPRRLGNLGLEPKQLAEHHDRVLIARGRDAADVSISNTFGENLLKSFLVRADEVREQD